MPRPFAIGRAFEYRVKRHYEKKGYYVKRSYGSLGLYDLVCYKRKGVLRAGDYKEEVLTEVIFVETKTSENAKYKFNTTNEKRIKLIELAMKVGARAVYVYKNKFRGDIVEVPLSG